MTTKLPLFLALINFIVLLIISGFHFYWAFGKNPDFIKTVPTNSEGKQVIAPKKIDCFIVAIFLLAFSLLFLHRTSLLPFYLPQWILFYGIWVISSIFLIRAIGDFNYVGFTKKISTTDFAKMDTMYYSPLCLLLGINGILIQLL